MNGTQKFWKLVLINLGAIAIALTGLILDTTNAREYIGYYMTFVSTEVAYLLGKNHQAKKQKPKKDDKK